MKTRTSTTGKWTERMRRGLLRITGSPASGFTLVELLVVLFVISLAIALVMPKFADTGSELKAEARKAAVVLRYLNETATMKKKTLFMKVNLDEKTMEWGETAGENREALENLEAVELQTTGLVKEGEVTVFFTPLGLGQNMNIYLRSGEGEKAVSLNPASGRVRILDAEAHR